MLVVRTAEARSCGLVAASSRDVLLTSSVWSSEQSIPESRLRTRTPVAQRVAGRDSRCMDSAECLLHAAREPPRAQGL
jgi:hypothetical protein